MARDTFPSPKYNTIIEPNSDKQIVTVPLEQVDFGARKVSQNESSTNSKSSIMSIRHVKG